MSRENQTFQSRVGDKPYVSGSGGGREGGVVWEVLIGVAEAGGRTSTPETTASASLRREKLILNKMGDRESEIGVRGYGNWGSDKGFWTTGVKVVIRLRGGVVVGCVWSCIMPPPPLDRWPASRFSSGDSLRRLCRRSLH